jgi:hypothetical protein
MIEPQAAPLALVLSLVVLLLAGLATLTWGRRLPRGGDWLAGIGLLVAVAGLAFAWVALSGAGLQPQLWQRGWIWPHDEAGAIGVGVLEDALGLTMSSLAVLVAAVFLVNTPLIETERRRERYFAALSCSTAGVALAWISLTPWFAFLGVGLASLGGFLAIGARWTEEGDSAASTRFAWERAAGLWFAVLGASILAGARGALAWPPGAAWYAQPGTFDVAGAVLLLSGLFVQLQAFPLVGPLSAGAALGGDGESGGPSGIEGAPSAFRTLLMQVFPAWAAFALLIRLEPQLRAVGVFPHAGWPAAVAAALTFAPALLRSEWRAGLAHWTAAGFCVALAELAFSGPFAGLCALTGVSLGALGVASAGAALEIGGNTSNSNRKRAAWARAGIFAGAACGSALFGFVGASGALRWGTGIAASSGDTGPAEIVALALLVFLLSTMAWKLGFVVSRARNFTSAAWYSVLAPLAFGVLGLGLFWTGGVTGGAVSGDAVMPSLLSLFFGSAPAPQGGELAAASWMVWVPTVLGAGLAYWMNGRGEDRWQKAARAKFAQFVSGGYGIDAVAARTRELGLALGRGIHAVVDTGLWGRWWPALASGAIRRGSRGVARADDGVSVVPGVALRRAIDVPAKFLQLVQSGDVQWYLFFAVGSGIALLLHFLGKTT